MKRSPLRDTPRVDHSSEPGYSEWKRPVFGRCGVCGVAGLNFRHHVVTESHLRAEGRDPWDLRNALAIGDGRKCSCHRDHHSACARIPVSKVPDQAIRFVVEVYGPGAGAYLSRYYAAA